MSDRLTILAPAFYPSRDRVRFYLDSAARQGLEPVLYGIGEKFINPVDTHITRFVPELRKVTTELVMFTDTCDVLFADTEQTILDGWELAGRPGILMSVEPDGGLNAGTYMGYPSDIFLAIETIRPMESGDPQVRWRQAVADGKIRHIRGDHLRLVFDVSPGSLELPSPVLHFPGGYSDPDTGRDYRIKPIFEELCE